jgi:hypothetical protein
VEHICHTPAGSLTRGAAHSPRRPLPYLGTHPNTAPFRVHNVLPSRGMLYTMETLATPFAYVKEALIGFRVRDTSALGLFESQRVQLLGQCTDLNTMTWTLSTIRTLTLLVQRDPRCTPSPTHWKGTSCLDLTGMMDTLFLPPRGALTLPSAPPLAPTPFLWTPKYQPEQ